MIDMDNLFILDLERQKSQALMQQDYDLFKSLCHPDLIYVHSSGKVDSLHDYYQKLCNQVYLYTDIEHDIQQIMNVNQGIVTLGEYRSGLRYFDEQRQMHNRTISYWVDHQGQYKLISYQSTPIK